MLTTFGRVTPSQSSLIDAAWLSFCMQVLLPQSGPQSGISTYRSRGSDTMLACVRSSLMWTMIIVSDLVDPPCLSTPSTRMFKGPEMFSTSISACASPRNSSWSSALFAVS